MPQPPGNVGRLRHYTDIMTAPDLAQHLRNVVTGMCGHAWTDTRPDTTWTAPGIDDDDWRAVHTAADARAAACGYPPGETILDTPGSHTVRWACPGRPSVYLICARHTVVHTAAGAPS